MIHSSFAVVYPRRDFGMLPSFLRSRLIVCPTREGPEHLVRVAQAARYKLAGGTSFGDPLTGGLGPVGICGGYGEFQPGTSLPCHIHDYDESIAIIKGTATCEGMGSRYQFSGYDTAMVPGGRPHRFLNEPGNVMAMIWVYAGSEPHRSIVNSRFCNGDREWRGRK
jgi:quercetin dioxygenase-like cupin family protein